MLCLGFIGTVKVVSTTASKVRRKAAVCESVRACACVCYLCGNVSGSANFFGYYTLSNSRA